jgi:hypothetical protein
MLLIAPHIDVVAVKASTSFTDQHRTTTSEQEGIDNKGLTRGGSSAPKTEAWILAKSLKTCIQQALQNQWNL